MKTKDKKELHTKSLEELKKIVKEAKDLVSGFMLDKSQNKLKNPRQIFWKRKEIATALTIIRAKELALVNKK